MPEAVREKLVARHLYQVQLDGGLLFLEEDRGEFYRVYYYLSDSFRGSELTLDKDAVIEFPFTPPLKLDTRHRGDPELINRLGFTIGRESAFRAGDAGAVLMEAPALPEGYSVIAARLEQMPEIMTLFRASFNPLYAFLPTEDELAERIESGCVFVVEHDGAVVGALNGHRERNAAICDHVAIIPSCRGNGLSKALLVRHHRLYEGLVRVYQAWTDKNNRVSMSMYTSLGYSHPQRRAAYEYIKLTDKAGRPPR